MKGMHGKRKIMFEASFHAARMSLTVKTLRITIRPKENRYCSTNSYTSFHHIDTIFSK